MNQTAAFIERLGNDRLFGAGERAMLRALAGRGLDESLPGFDLFTGLWWPLRKESQAAPRREVAWLIAKVYAAFPLPQVDGDRHELPVILGRCEPRDEHDGPRLRRRFRRRFDALLCSPLAQLEPHLHWALSVVRSQLVASRAAGLDWVKLTDHLSIWDRGPEHHVKRDVHDLWAEQYLKAIYPPNRGDSYVDRNSHDPEPQPVES
ncbi:MAG: type I-E CRISPR-associated protein Cse2/CasB [Thermoguttaceae bacterium]